MGITIVKIKIMPESPQTNLEEIKLVSEGIINQNNGTVARIEEEPIAFGLIAVIITFSISESQELEPIEEALSKIKNVSSTQIIDMRRAFG